MKKRKPIISLYFKYCSSEFYNYDYNFELSICKSGLSRFFYISDKADKILVQACNKKPTDGECLTLKIDRHYMTVYIYESDRGFLDWSTEQWILNNKVFDNIDTFYVVVYEYMEQ